ATERGQGQRITAQSYRGIKHKGVRATRKAEGATQALAFARGLQAIQERRIEEVDACWRGMARPRRPGAEREVFLSGPEHQTAVFGNSVASRAGRQVQTHQQGRMARRGLRIQPAYPHLLLCHSLLRISVMRTVYKIAPAILRNRT